MNGNILVFDEEFLWDGSLWAVRLIADQGKHRLRFVFDGAAINDYYRTEDSRDAAMRNFEENRPWFESVATSLVSEGHLPDERGLYFVVLDTLHRFRP